jgi:hypothetical protein
MSHNVALSSFRRFVRKKEIKVEPKLTRLSEKEMPEDRPYSPLFERDVLGLVALLRFNKEIDLGMKNSPPTEGGGKPV